MFNDEIDERPRCVACGEVIEGTPFTAPGGEDCCGPACVERWFLGPYEGTADAARMAALREQASFRAAVRP